MGRDTAILLPMADAPPHDTSPLDTPLLDTVPLDNVPTRPQGIRARVREELTREIKRSAREQLVTAGADALSLRAIARDLDMASSAIYRYFASRDDLLTALIVDAYDTLGAQVEAADAAVDPDDHLARWRAIGTAHQAVGRAPTPTSTR